MTMHDPYPGWMAEQAADPHVGTKTTRAAQEVIPSVDIGPVSVTDAHRILEANGWRLGHGVTGRECYGSPTGDLTLWDLGEAVRAALNLEDVR